MMFDLVAAVGALLGRPHLAGDRVHRQPELVAVTERVDLRLVAGAVDKGVVGRHGAVVAQANQLAAVVRGILRWRVLALRRVAHAHVEHAVTPEHDARGLGDHVVDEDLLELRQRRTVPHRAGQYGAARRGGGWPAAARGRCRLAWRQRHRLVIRQVDVAVGCKLRVQRDVHQPREPLRRNRRQAATGAGSSTPLRTGAAGRRAR